MQANIRTRIGIQHRSMKMPVWAFAFYVISVFATGSFCFGQEDIVNPNPVLNASNQPSGGSSIGNAFSTWQLGESSPVGQLFTDQGEVIGQPISVGYPNEVVALDSPVDAIALNSNLSSSIQEPSPGLAFGRRLTRRRSGPQVATNSTFSIFGGWSLIGQRDPYYGYSGGRNFSSGRVQDGYMAGIATGRQWSSRIRSEFEFSYRRNEVYSGYYYLYPYVTNSLTIAPGFERDRGEIHSYSGLANFYYDFDRGPNRILTPYVGVGLGITYFDTDVTVGNAGETYSNESAFAFQAIGGLSAKLGSRADLFVEYRFFKTAEDDFFLPESAGPFNSYYTNKFTYSHEDSNLLLGLRFRF